jgi:hypothetical protein
MRHRASTCHAIGGCCLRACRHRRDRHLHLEQPHARRPAGACPLPSSSPSLRRRHCVPCLRCLPMRSSSSLVSIVRMRAPQYGNDLLALPQQSGGNGFVDSNCISTGACEGPRMVRRRGGGGGGAPRALSWHQPRRRGTRPTRSHARRRPLGRRLRAARQRLHGLLHEPHGQWSRLAHRVGLRLRVALRRQQQRPGHAGASADGVRRGRS